MSTKGNTMQKTGTYVHDQSKIRTHNPKVRVTKNHTQIIPSGYCEQCWQFHFYNENFLNEVMFRNLETGPLMMHVVGQ
jgi:hypothetical protein